MKSAHLLFSLLAALPLSCPAADPAPAAPAAPSAENAKPELGKADYHLFMGTRLAHLDKDNANTIVGLRKDSLIVGEERKNRRLVNKYTLKELKVSNDLMLSRSFAHIVNLRVEPCFSPGNNPTENWARQMQTAMAMHTRSSEISDSQALVVTDFIRDKPREMTAEQEKAWNQQLESLRTRFSNTVNMGTFSPTTAQQGVQRANSIDQEAYDAVSLDFTLTAREPYSDVYAIVIAQFIDRTDPSGKIQSWIHLQELGDLNGQDQHMSFKGVGLPPGYILKDTRLHLYVEGREIATNITPKCSPLTHETAFKFIYVDHLARHKKDNVEPSLGIAFLPNPLRNQLREKTIPSKIFVRIDEAGSPLSFANAEAPDKPLPADLLAALKDFRFKPALRSGQPTAGELTFSLGSVRL